MILFIHVFSQSIRSAFFYLYFFIVTGLVTSLFFQIGTTPLRGSAVFIVRVFYVCVAGRA